MQPLKPLSIPYVAGKDDKHTTKLGRSDYLQRTAVKAMQGLTSTAAGDDEQYCKQQEFTLDDMGNARRLVAMCGNSIRSVILKIVGTAGTVRFGWRMRQEQSTVLRIIPLKPCIQRL